jgi:hypothetical protein
VSLSQNDAGRAFEHAIIMSLADLLPSPVTETTRTQNAQACFAITPPLERLKMIAASKEAVSFIISRDCRLLEHSCTISLQSDQEGMHGDVRDIVIHNTNLGQDIGISAKNHHWAVKHSRLSGSLDFGSEWLSIRCSDNYFNQVSPIFNELKCRKKQNEKWRDVLDKKKLYYVPILSAFQTEMQALFNNNPHEVPRRLVKYLLGRYDYYKIIRENGDVSILSFNIDGTLEWGNKIPLPTLIMNISQKPQSETTVMMYFDKGWQISFRIHSASTYVEPSLKFDINIVGLPSTLSRQVIRYNR